MNPPVAWMRCVLLGCLTVLAVGRVPAASSRAEPARNLRSAQPHPSPTRLPPVDPTPHGGRVPVGAPLPIATLNPSAINSANSWALAPLPALEPTYPEGESVVAFTRDGTRMVTAAGTDLLVRRLPAGNVVVNLGAASGSFGARIVSPDGATHARANENALGHVVLRAMANGATLREHRGGEQVRDMAFALDGMLLAAVRADHELTIWDVATGRMESNTGLTERYQECCPVMAARPDGRELAVGIGGEVRLLDPATAEVVSSFRPGAGVVAGLRYRPDGRALLVMARLGTGFQPMPFAASIWEDGRRVGGFQYENAPYFPEASWSADGRWLAVSGRAGILSSRRCEMWLWDTVTGRAERIVSQTNAAVAGLDWAPAGPLLAFGLTRYNNTPEGTFPGAIRLYDPISARQVAALDGVVEPRFSPDGSLLIAHADGVTDSALIFLAVDPAAPTLTVTPTASQTPTPTATATVTDSPTVPPETRLFLPRALR